MKKHRKRKLFITFLLIILLVCGIFAVKGKINIQEVFCFGEKKADTSLGWNLILVNKDYYVPDDYNVSFTTLSNGKKVDSRIYPELQKMFNDARSIGLRLFVREGYRTFAEQQKILDDKISAYKNEGYSENESKMLAKNFVAVPGTSEHQLGISVDINAEASDYSSEEEVYTWLNNNAYKYGFIKRYPSDKVDITGINNEPWHYRYVGKKAAKEMKVNGICLEEYIEKLKS